MGIKTCLSRAIHEKHVLIMCVCVCVCVCNHITNVLICGVMCSAAYGKKGLAPSDDRVEMVGLRCRDHNMFLSRDARETRFDSICVCVCVCNVIT